MRMVPSVPDHRNWSFIPLIQMIQIMPRLLDHNIGEQQHGDQVGNGHQSVQDIGDAPNQLLPEYSGQ